MHHLLLICVVLLGSAFSREACPEFITCDTSDGQDSCPQGTFYRQHVKLHNCCPGCIPLKDEGQHCVAPEECQPGLTCTSLAKCEPDPAQACEHYKRYDSVYTKSKYWNPLCLPDATFAPKQCKGEKMAGKCFCVSAEGRRIFGEEEWSGSERMSCGCSRTAEVMRRGGSEVSLHCDVLGNYEPLQCQQKVCWCANPTSGVPYTAMVPLEMMTFLPCYDRSGVGAQYHRQCDSAHHIQEMTKSLLWNHGTTGISLFSQPCNFDGSYHRVQPFREKKRCVYLDNSPLTEAVKSPPNHDTNCNCAYDRHLAALRQTPFFADCDPNGNYRSRQAANDKLYCVDQDGFHFSDDPDDCPSV